ncbi:hypothetical protein M3484_03335 [Pseudomonas sp. GX19020]|uniref:hypothetical protein n=1 Tax=Pseudomonas sp. GX19020 TaxID=2942277 RepID=UPI00201878CD|nr:hypothetical protein [Pseudomonas sp. GX19020]MCL4065605.1 hypothetical protein [Pseudomonas sp. GX19020]
MTSSPAPPETVRFKMPRGVLTRSLMVDEAPIDYRADAAARDDAQRELTGIGACRLSDEAIGGFYHETVGFALIGRLSELVLPIRSQWPFGSGIFACAKRVTVFRVAASPQTTALRGLPRSLEIAFLLVECTVAKRKAKLLSPVLRLSCTPAPIMVAPLIKGMAGAPDKGGPPRGIRLRGASEQAGAKASAG